MYFTEELENTIVQFDQALWDIKDLHDDTNDLNDQAIMAELDRIYQNLYEFRVQLLTMDD